MDIQVTPEGKIEWLCDACSGVIADEDGAIWCDAVAGQGREEEILKWHESHTGAVPIDQFLDAPGDLEWASLHFACFAEGKCGPYSIEVERIRSLADVLVWSNHLLGKTWISTATNWGLIMKEIGIAGGSKEL